LIDRLIVVCSRLRALGLDVAGHAGAGRPHTMLGRRRPA